LFVINKIIWQFPFGVYASKESRIININDTHPCGVIV
jgi:hypothetical protein